jgi:hypothetical protein
MFAPKIFTQGDTLTFDVTDPQGRTSGAYTLTFSLRGTNTATATGTASGNSWTVTLIPTQTAALAAGLYFYSIVIAKTGERWTLESGEITVAADVSAQAAGYDGRTQAEIDLAAVRAEIRARITGNLTWQYMIGNRELRKEETPNLLELERKLKADVMRETMARKIALGIGTPKNVLVRFGTI